jgi:transketolase
MRYGREATPVVTTEKTPLRFGEANVIRYRSRRRMPPGAAEGAFPDAFDVTLASEYAGEGEDLTIVACGPMVCEAMRAALILREEFGLETRVINMHTVKPLDQEALRRAARETGVILTCEEHQKGGFGNFVAGVICSRQPGERAVVFDSMGVEDRFGESGRPWELMIRFGLTAEHIAAKAKVLVRGGKGTQQDS